MAFSVYRSRVPLACSSKLLHIVLENQTFPSHTVRFFTLMASFSTAVFSVNYFFHCCDQTPDMKQPKRRGDLFGFTVRGIQAIMWERTWRQEWLTATVVGTYLWANQRAVRMAFCRLSFLLCFLGPAFLGCTP